MIQASCQTSRFAEHDVGIDLKQVNISVGDKVLLVDASVQLKTGVHYGLLGRNGVGKSVLLNVLTTGQLLSPSLRSSMRVQLIRQTLDDDESAAVGAGSKGKREAGPTVLDVLNAKPFGMDFVVSEAQKWKMLAEQQSGARGKLAREMAVMFERLELEAESASVGSDYDEDDDVPLDPATVRQVARSLGFDELMLQRPMDTLSGGQKMRVHLMRAQLHLPDLLLLDEPTNHLDIAGVAWLQDVLNGPQFAETTIVFVSHNRTFINQVAKEMILFKNRKLEYFRGNYDEVMATLEEKEAYAGRMQDALDRKRERMAASIEQNRKLALKAGDDKRLKQVASKQTKLEERVGFERNEKGHRFKLNRDRAGYHLLVRGEVEHVEDETSQTRLYFNFPQPVLPRSSGPLLTVEDVTFRRCNDKKEVTFQLSGITFACEAGQRVALLGENGEGKSTLLNLLSDAWSPAAGSIQKKTQQIGYFRQHVVAELGRLQVSPLDRLTELYPTAKAETLWNHLGRFGLGSPSIATTSLGNLSGGQRVTYAFAELTYACPCLLLLDEPNSHLDLEALEALASSLAAYEGGVVFVSHDISFIKDVATHAFWIEDGKMTPLSLDTLESVALAHKDKRAQQLNPATSAASRESSRSSVAKGNVSAETIKRRLLR